MSGIGRAFVAVEVPEEVARTVAAHLPAGRGDDGLRWVAPSDWHVTLEFLGRVAEPETVAAALGAPLAHVEPFEVRLGGGGAFPSARRASVLWLGVTEGATAIAELAGTVSGVTATLGFAPDDRTFRPHLTLARCRRGRDLRPLVDAVGTGPVGPRWWVEEVVLFESETRAEGARYTPVSRLPLGPRPAGRPARPPSSPPGEPARPA